MDNVFNKVTDIFENRLSTSPLSPQQWDMKLCVERIIVPIFQMLMQLDFNQLASIFDHLSSHLNSAIPAQQPTMPAEPIDLKMGHHPSPKDWKSYPTKKEPDFSFVKPVVDVKNLDATEEEKKLIEKNSLGKFKESMKVMDHSIADTVSHMMGEKTNPELWQTLDKFSSRYLDLYEAYIDVQKDNNEPFFYSDIGFAKAYGFTHQDLKNLIEPAHWFMQQPSHIKEKVLSNKLSPSELKKSKGKAEKIQGLYNRLSGFGVNHSRIDELVDKLGGSKETPLHQMGSKDSKYALLEEIRSRTDNGEKEPGFLGSPLRLLNVVKGNHITKEDPSATYRQKLYFIYKSKSIANEIASNPEMVKKINQKLEKKGWQIDNGIAEFLHQSTPTIPIFKLGQYAHENHAKGKIREPLPMDKVLEGAKNSPNMTFTEVEKLAEGNITSPFRFKPSSEEEMAYLGSTSEIENRLMAARGNNKARNQKADASYFESPFDYKKRTTPLPWIAGQHYFKLHDDKECKSPYLKAVKALGLPQKAGISGSTDQTLTMAGLVGVSSQEEIKRLRLIYLGWMTSHDDHSVDEIMTSAKSFGIPYTPKPDYYKEIYAEDPNFASAVSLEQEKRGFKMPDFYLSKEHAQAELEKIRNTKEQKQAQEVKEAMSGHNLFLKAINGKKNNAEQYKTDIFGTNSWKGYLNNLVHPKKKAKVDGIKYIHNPATKKLEPKQKSTTPYYKGNKKNSVSLVPSSGKILPYHYDLNDTVGLLFDKKESEFKDKYVFKADALTDNKWWRRLYTPQQIKSPKFTSLLKRDVKIIQSKKGKGIEQSFDHLRTGKFENLVNIVEKDKTFQKHNEILASLKKEGIKGVFCLNKANATSPAYNLFIRMKAVANKMALKEKYGIDVPVFVIDQAKDQGLQHYSRTEQAKDLECLISNHNGEFDALVDLLAEKSQLDKEQVAKSLLKDLKQMHSL